MNCMRCGQEIVPGQVFCEDCRAVMEKHPINPDAPVYLPRRQESAPVKKQPKKRVISPEEQIPSLKKRLRFFIVWSLVSTLLAAALAYSSLRHLIDDQLKPGQNYSSYNFSNSTETTPE